MGTEIVKEISFMYQKGMPYMYQKEISCIFQKGISRIFQKGISCMHQNILKIQAEKWKWWECPWPLLHENE